MTSTLTNNASIGQLVRVLETGEWTRMVYDKDRWEYLREASKNRPILGKLERNDIGMIVGKWGNLYVCLFGEECYLFAPHYLGKPKRDAENK